MRPEVRVPGYAPGWLSFPAPPDTGTGPGRWTAGTYPSALRGMEQSAKTVSFILFSSFSSAFSPMPLLLDPLELTAQLGQHLVVAGQSEIRETPEGAALLGVQTGMEPFVELPDLFEARSGMQPVCQLFYPAAQQLRSVRYSLGCSGQARSVTTRSVRKPAGRIPQIRCIAVGLIVF